MILSRTINISALSIFLSLPKHEDGFRTHTNTHTEVLFFFQYFSKPGGEVEKKCKSIAPKVSAILIVPNSFLNICYLLRDKGKLFPFKNIFPYFAHTSVFLVPYGVLLSTLSCLVKDFFQNKQCDLPGRNYLTYVCILL